MKHIEQSLRVFGTWLADNLPAVTSCAELTRDHIEEFKKWLSTHRSERTGQPLSRSSVKEHLINLGCFFDRITERGYPDPPRRHCCSLAICRSPTSLFPGSSTTRPQPSLPVRRAPNRIRSPGSASKS